VHLLVRWVCLLLCVSSPVALAADARVSLLTKQLATAKDVRVRAQTVALLGKTGSPDAVAPLCSVLSDSDSLLRSTAARALGVLGLPEAAVCLKRVSQEPDESVRKAVSESLALLTGGRSAPLGGVYLNVEPISDKTPDGLANELMSLADRLLRERLVKLGARLAPANEDKKAAQAIISSKNLRGYQLRLQLLPGSTASGLKVEMLVMTYPGQSLQGSWNVKASGGSPEALLKAMVPRVVEDAAGDLNWSSRD
jgi:hypothetical protein